MFEKLKEYSLYIIISVFWMWALFMMYYQYSNSKNWEEMINALQVSISEWLWLPQTLKNNVTIVDSLIKLSWKSLWKYKLNTNQVIFFNVDWENLIKDWENNNLTLEQHLPPELTTEKKILELYIVPEHKIWWILDSWIEWEWYVLERKKIDWWIYKETNELIKVNEEARWFLKTWYLWVWSFLSKKDAEEFIKEYLTTWIVVKLKENQYWIFFQFYS